MEKKRVGIVCDDYKVRKFKRKLETKGFEFETKPYRPGLTLIVIDTTMDKVSVIAAVCRLCEIEFKQ